MPDVFLSDPYQNNSTDTSWFLLNGAEGVSNGEGSLDFKKITDGTSSTMVLVESNRKVHWAKPEDIDLEATSGFPKLTGSHNGGFLAAMAGGSTYLVSENADPKNLWKFYTANGGEDNDYKWLRTPRAK